LSFIPPTFKTAMEHFICCAGHADCSPSSSAIFADGGYAGEKMALVVWRTGTWKLEIVKRPDAIGFEVCPKDGSSKGHSLGSAAIVA